jgi:hypothetical protein
MQRAFGLDISLTGHLLLRTGYLTTDVDIHRQF